MLRIYSVSDRYIAYLRKDERLRNVFDSKEATRSHTRKYLGVVIEKNGHDYYIPFSSPKKSDYVIDEKGDTKIRKSIIPIIRMTTNDSLTGKMELKGTLKISNMIPVPRSELAPYDISSETDPDYKLIVTKEYDFIKANAKMIRQYAGVLYNEKTKDYGNLSRPNYLTSCVDFKYAEEKCRKFEERAERLPTQPLT